MSSIPSTTGWKTEDHQSDYILYSKDGAVCLVIETEKQKAEIYVEAPGDDGKVEVTGTAKVNWEDALKMLGITQEQVDERPRYVGEEG